MYNYFSIFVFLLRDNGYLDFYCKKINQITSSSGGTHELAHPRMQEPIVKFPGIVYAGHYWKFIIKS